MHVSETPQEGKRPNGFTGMNGASHAEYEGHTQATLHNLEAEQALLGAVLSNNDVLAQVADILQAAHFYDPLHQAIYETASKLIAEGRPADPITLKPFFQNVEPINRTMSGLQYLDHLVANAGIARYARGYAETIGDLFYRRQMILIGEETARAASETRVDFPLDQQLEEAITRLSSLRSAGVATGSSALEFPKDAPIGSTSAYVVKQVVPSAAVVAVYSPSGAGKTFWLIDGGFAVALGKPFMGRRTRRGAVLYVALEGHSGFARRLAAAMQHHGDPGPNFARLKNLVTLGRAAKAEADVTRIISAARELAKQADAEVVLIIIDTLARALAGDNENEAAAISSVVSQANRIAAETGAAVVFAHHPGKDQERGMRGSSALGADFDVVIKIDRQPDAATRNVVLEKAKDGEEGVIGNFRLRRIVLGQDDEGDDITSCIVEHLDVQASHREVKRPKPGTAAAVALNELDHLVLAGKYRISANHDRIPDRVKLVLKTDWRDACLAKQLSADGDREAEKKAFSRAASALGQLGCIGQFGEHVWRIEKTPGTFRGHGHFSAEGHEGTSQGHSPAVDETPAKAGVSTLEGTSGTSRGHVG